MTVSQKAALSLLVSVLLFAVFSVLAFTGLFDFIETRFYNPSITSSLMKELGRDALSVDSFLNFQQNRFTAALGEPSVKRSFLSNQSGEDIYDRTRIFGALHESLGGLQWIRFIDSGGIRLNYSTYPPDILNQDSNFIAYRNYPGLNGALPYEMISSVAGEKGRIILDEEGDRILFSIPFYDFYEVFRGTALFSLSVRALSEQLISEGRIKAGDDVSVIYSPPGVLIGRPVSTGKTLFPQISSVWREGIANIAAIESSLAPPDFQEPYNPLMLISVKTARGLYAGRLINESVFSFPQTMKIILLVSFFLTVYLTIFLLFNLRQDSITIVQNRLKQLQISLIEQYYERKGSMDWGRWSRELELRREEIRGELKKGVKTGKKADGKNDIDQLIDKSWDELLAVIGGRRETAAIDEDKLQTILNRILAAPAGDPKTQNQTPHAAADTAAPVEDIAEAEPADLEPIDLEPLDDEPAVPGPARVAQMNAGPVAVPAGAAPANARPAGVAPARVAPADDEPSDLEPAELEPAELEPAELEPAELEPLDAEPVILAPFGTAFAAPIEAAPLKPVEAVAPAPAGAASAEPLDLEPAELEPADLEPVDSEPLDAEPVEPVEPAPVDSESAEPLDSEPVEAEPAELESAGPEPVELPVVPINLETEVIELEPVVKPASTFSAKPVETGSVEPAEAEFAELESLDVEPVEPALAGTASAEPVETEPAEPESAGPEPADAELAELEPAHDEPEPSEPELVEVEPDEAELAELESAHDEREPAVLAPVENEPAELEPVDDHVNLKSVDWNHSEPELTELEPADDLEDLDEMEELQSLDGSEEPAPGSPDAETASTDAEPAEPVDAELPVPDAEPADTETSESEPFDLESIDADSIDFVSVGLAPDASEPAELEPIGADSVEDKQDKSEELEELEELDGGNPDSQEMSETDLEELVRSIEFGEVLDNDDYDESAFNNDLEIASPFKTMFTQIGDASWVESEFPELEIQQPVKYDDEETGLIPEADEPGENKPEQSDPDVKKNS